MPYVQRDGAGKVIGTYVNPQPGYAIEFLADDNAEVVAFLNPPIEGVAVDAERERRIALPLNVTVSAGAFPIDMDPLSQRNLGGLASVGQYLVATGSSQTTTFRDHANASHSLTPADLVSMGLQVAGRIQAVYAKSWAIKALDPIPDDFTADSYWS